MIQMDLKNIMLSKRMYTEYFHLYKIQEEAKLIYITGIRTVLRRAGAEAFSTVDREGQGENFLR